MRNWIVHETRNAKGEIVIGSFDYCQSRTCAYKHFVHQPFRGTKPSWDHGLDRDGHGGYVTR